MVVSVDLTKPLVFKIRIEGHLQWVEYEGLPTICFECGYYGHLQEQHTRKATEAPTNEATRGEGKNQPALPQPAADGGKFGPWM